MGFDLCSFAIHSVYASVAGCGHVLAAVLMLKMVETVD